MAGGKAHSFAGLDEVAWNLEKLPKYPLLGRRE